MFSILSLSLILNVLLVYANANKKINKENDKSKIPEVNITELNESNLRFVFVLMRNGEQYPDNKMIKANPYYEYMNYRFPRGELNKEGRLTMYHAGLKLKEMYPEFLSRPYVRKHLVKVYGLGNRYTVNTRESALLVKAGLRGKDRKQTLKKRWSARKMASVRNDEFTDNAQDFHMGCKNYDNERKFALFKTLESLIKKDNYYKKLFIKLKRHTNLSHADFVKLYYLFELYETSELSKLGRPRWLSEDLWIKYYHLMIELAKASFSTKYLKTIGGGRSLRYFLNTLERRLNNTLQPETLKMMIHVGYETNVLPFFAALGGNEGFNRYSTNETYNTTRIFHGGMIVVEAYKVRNKYDGYYLRFFVAESLVAPLYELKKNGCDFPCAFDNIKNLVRDYSVDHKQWTEKCEQGDEKMKKKITSKKVNPE